MILKNRDLYTQYVQFDLISNETTIGKSIAQYEVRRYVDTRNLTRATSFVVTCTQRIVIPGPVTFAPAAQQISGYYGYPALFTNQVALIENGDGDVIAAQTLIDYAPKTLNTAVTSSNNDSSSSSTSNSQQYSSGSTTAQSNSYGASVSVGLVGDMPMGSIGGSASKTSTSEESTGSSSGEASEAGNQYSNASSMSIKDWGSYAQIDATNTIPTWVWGQEYPWDVIQFRNIDQNDNVILPDYVVARLYDGIQVYPPSELSLLGVNFVSKAAWLVTLNPGNAGPATIAVSHSLTYCNATHKIDSGALVATIDTYTPIVQVNPTLDLPVLAVDALGPGTGPALIGFVANQFDVAPSDGGAFAITAESNLMLVRGTGFNGVMSTDFSAGSVTLTLYFKLTDSSTDISLSMKHWVTSGGTCQIALDINGTTNMVKFVNAPEAGAGGDNVSVIPLRCKDFTSVDYCDFLQFGLNTITLTLTSTGAPGATYTLQAMAVG